MQIKALAGAIPISRQDFAKGLQCCKRIAILPKLSPKISPSLSLREYFVFGLVLLVLGIVYLVFESIHLEFRMVCLAFGIKISPSHGLWEAPAAHVKASLATEKHKDIKKAHRQLDDDDDNDNYDDY